MKAVIFDMDGLMFDTERVFIKAWDYAGEKIGVGKAGYMTIKTLGMNAEKCHEVWTEEFGEGYDWNELRVYTKEYLKEYYATHKVPVKKGLYVLLEYLKEENFKLGVASSSPRHDVEYRLKDAGVTEYFETIVCGDMITNSKPDPEIYLRACKEIGEVPEDCYAIEDSKNGLLSAYGAGCKPIMVPDLWKPDEDILKKIVAKFDDLSQVRDAMSKKEL